MQNFLIRLLVCSVIMSVIALLYMACMPILTKRYSARGRYYAWLIIVVGLIIPFRPQWDNALIRMEAPVNEPPLVVQIKVETLGFYIPQITLPSSSTIGNPTLSNATANITWWQITVTIWLAGMLLFMAYHCIKHFRFVKMVRRWRENITDEQICPLLQKLKLEMGITKRIPLYVCPCVGSPMMVGLVKPKILFPTFELTQDEIFFILKHELMHYKRKDLLYKYLVLAATAIHWFNPVMYMMSRAISVLCEMSCDTEVVQSTDIGTRQSYSEIIIGVVKYQSKLKTSLSTNFYGGKKNMIKRILSIMDTSRKKVGAVIVCVILTLTLGTGVLFAFAEDVETSRVNDTINNAETAQPDNTPTIYESEILKSMVNENETPHLGEASTVIDSPAVQVELQSPYRLARTLEEVRAILALQNGTIPVTNVEVPEIMNHQSNGIFITEQDLDEALYLLNEAYGLGSGTVTNLVTTKILPPLIDEELEYFMLVGFANDIVKAAIDAGLNPEGVEIYDSLSFGISSDATNERVREEARRVLALHGEPSDALALETAQRLFGDN